MVVVCGLVVEKRICAAKDDQSHGASCRVERTIDMDVACELSIWRRSDDGEGDKAAAQLETVVGGEFVEDVREAWSTASKRRRTADAADEACDRVDAEECAGGGVADMAPGF